MSFRSHQNADERKGLRNNERNHGVGRNYYCFDDAERKRKTKSFPSTDYPRRYCFWRTSFKRSNKTFRPSLSCPIDTTAKGTNSTEYELFDDTYVDFMGKQVENGTTDSTNLQKKKSMTDLIEDGKKKFKSLGP